MRQSRQFIENHDLCVFCCTYRTYHPTRSLLGAYRISLGFSSRPQPTGVPCITSHSQIQKVCWMGGRGGGGVEEGGWVGGVERGRIEGGLEWRVG